nr:hypothetical protein [Rhodococcus rhodochrous]
MNRVDSSLRVPDRFEDFTSGLEQYFTGRGEGGTAGGALKKLGSELGFEFAHRLRECRLRQHQCLRRSSEGTVIGDGDEAP